MPAQTVIKLRRGTAAQWTSANPVLAAGEIGLETDTLRTKYGNGSSAWSALSYSVADASGTSSVDWTSVLNKPSTFPPSAHAASHGFGGADAVTIEPSQVTGLNTFIGDVQATLPNKQDKVTGVSDTEISYLDGVTSSIQTQLNGKAATSHTHTLSQITDYVPPVITFTNILMLMGA